MGRSWIRKLKINLTNIDEYYIDITPDNAAINNIESDEIFDQYKDVFEGKVGCVPGFEVHHQLREGAQPVYIRERPVPYALTDKS